MNHPVIRVEKLGKLYRIGSAREGNKTFREAVTDMIAAPWRYMENTFHKQAITGEDQQSDFIWALKDVSFEVQRGEVVGIIGRNGAGKSTLLKILSRITEPTEGRITLRGRIGSLLEVGTGFHSELTGEENIYLSGTILGMGSNEISRKFDEIVAFSEMEKFIHTPVKHYSSGMYMRLAFAVAAHLEPEILLVDEVLAVGDAQFQKKCLGKMGDVAKEGRTVLFVSHNMTAIKSLCRRAIMFEKGQIGNEGEAGRVVSDYLQEGTRSLMEQVWHDPATAPGNDKVRLHSASLCSVNKKADELITIENEIEIEFVIWNYMEDAILNFTLHLFTIEGTYVLAAGSDVANKAKGMVRGIVTIPAHFLNTGIYRVEIMVVTDTSIVVLHEHNVLVFEIHEVERKGSWFGKWPGVVRPQLKWCIDDNTQ